MLLTVDLDRLDVRPGQRVLDAGCGEGRHCFGVLSRGANVVGLDLDPDAMRLASRALRSQATERGALGAMLRGDTFRLPFADASFDRVICAEVMEHVHQPGLAARELARVTRPGGRIAVTIPTTTSEHLYLRLGDDYFESPGGHIRIFKPRELAHALAGAGLATRGVSFAHGLHTPYWALRSIVGLPRADDFVGVRLYRRLLVHAVSSPMMHRLEKLLDHVCPKSLVLYAEKPGAPA